MKTRLILFVIVLTGLFLSSCATTYYQVYRATPTNEMIVDERNLIYEDEFCEVTYNLWSEGGNMGFNFYNKTDKNIYLNLKESFFIHNGLAFDYFKNRVFSNSSNIGAKSTRSGGASKSELGFNFFGLLQTNKISAEVSESITNSIGNSVSFEEVESVCIPPNAYKIITEYNIINSIYRDCDLLLYPNKKNIKTKNFTKSDSPAVFSNRISYSIGDSNNQICFENEFYITEITNYPEKEITEMKYSEFCNEESENKLRYFKNVSSDKFYMRYIKNLINASH